ncbi:twin-arginine translocation signal domain-containing protein [Halosimplex pelagicum]|uniref:Uncharacterized protein n=1 Tax=Halosimplex pelagicum TaxID=869886 RepID=A0A7D5P3U4_9EURY|nr:twin-arginine translocation signal domain-containing protein [Halosimplex pelagicum]QLH80223.1 hypothetical protein HZS54_00660 [Halosimplex pelagicum]
MTDRETSIGDRTRRSILKKGALATGAAVGVAGCAGLGDEGPAAQTDTDGDGATDTDVLDDGTDGDDAVEAGSDKALMFAEEFRGGAQFRVTSPVIEQQPEVEGVEDGDIWSDYNTRVVEYVNAEEDVLFFPAHDAEITEGRVYELHDNFTWLSDDAGDQGVVDVKFTEVGQEQIFDPSDVNVFDEGGGKALVRWGNYWPGAILRITSDVVEWTPRDDVAGSDVFADYNTRFARWINGGNFQIYPAGDASIERGQAYRMTSEFDVTDPEGNLVTTDLERVELPEGVATGDVATDPPTDGTTASEDTATDGGAGTGSGTDTPTGS